MTGNMGPAVSKTDTVQCTVPLTHNILTCKRCSIFTPRVSPNHVSDTGTPCTVKTMRGKNDIFRGLGPLFH